MAGCTVSDKTSLTVLRDTRKQRKPPVTLKAYNSGLVSYDKLELSENKSFLNESNVKGTQKAVIYAGTFTETKDTLILNFHNNHKESMWTGKAVSDTSERLITLLSKHRSFNKEMTITN